MARRAYIYTEVYLIVLLLCRYSCPWGEPRCCLGSLQSWDSLHRLPLRNSAVPVGAKGMATSGGILHPPIVCACACVCIAFHSVVCPRIICLYLPRFAVLSQLSSWRGSLWAWVAGLGNPHPLFRLTSPSSVPLGSVVPRTARVRSITSMTMMVLLGVRLCACGDLFLPLRLYIYYGARGVA